MNGALLPAAANSIVTSTVLPTLTSVAAASEVTQLNARWNAADMAAAAALDLDWDLLDDQKERLLNARTEDYSSKKRRKGLRKKLLRESRREQRSLPVERKVKLYCKTQRTLQIWPDGTVNGTLDANPTYGILNLITLMSSVVWPGSKESEKETDGWPVSIQGIASKRYLCMDKKGRLYGGVNRTDECKFYNNGYLHHFYEIYYSKKYSTNSKKLYIALNRNGRPGSGLKAQQKQDRAQWLTKSLDEKFKVQQKQDRTQWITSLDKKFNRGMDPTKNALQMFSDSSRSTVAPASTAAPRIRHRKRKNRRRRRRRRKHNKHGRDNRNKNRRGKERQTAKETKAVEQDDRKDVIVEHSGNDKSLVKQNEKLQSENQKTESGNSLLVGSENTAITLTAPTSTSVQERRTDTPSTPDCGEGGADPASKSRSSSRRRRRKHRKRRGKRKGRHRKSRNKDRTST